MNIENSKDMQFEHATKSTIIKEHEPNKDSENILRMNKKSPETQRRAPLCDTGMRLNEKRRTPHYDKAHVRLTVKNSKLAYNSIEAHASTYRGVRVYIEACASMNTPTPPLIKPEYTRSPN